MQKTNYSPVSKDILIAALTALSLAVSYLIRYEANVPQGSWEYLLASMAPIMLMRIAASRLLGLHRHKWRYTSLWDARPTGISIAIVSGLLLVLRFVLPGNTPALRMPVGVILVDVLLFSALLMGSRIVWRLVHEKQQMDSKTPRKRLLLVGAGFHGATVAREMSHNKGIEVVGFSDDDLYKANAIISGIPVLGPISALPELVEKYRVDEVLVCIPPSERAAANVDQLLGKSAANMRVMQAPEEMLENPISEIDIAASNEVVVSRVRRTVTAGTSPGLGATRIEGQTILITGGAGFIGSALAERLVANNKVVLYDTGFDGRRPFAFSPLRGHPNVRLAQGDIMTDNDLERECGKADMIVHAAAILGVNKVINAARETLETNYVGTSRILQAAEANSRLKRLVYFSTSEVFGVNSYRVDELTSPSIGPIAESRWGYAIAKLAGEHLVKAHFRENRMPVCIVRPFNVYGPRRTGDYALLRFIVNALHNAPIEVHGDGSQIRSWCYIDDFVNAIVAMLERQEAVGEDFNIGNSSTTITVADLARRVTEISESNSRIYFIDHPFPDISIRVPSLAKAAKILDYAPRVDLDNGLSRTIDWYRNNLEHFPAPKPLSLKLQASAAR